MKKNQYMK